MKDILRWIAIPFASLAAMFLACLIMGIILWLNNCGYSWYTGEPVTRLSEILALLFRDGVAGYAFVLAGSYTAPKHNKVVSIVLATIMGVLSITSIALTIYLGREWITILGAIANMAGAVYAANSVEETKA